MSAQDKDQIARDIENLVEIFNRSEWEEMHLKTDDVEIFLSNDPNASLTSAPVATAAVSAVSSLATPASVTASGDATTSVAESSPVTSQPSVVVPDGMIAVTAPNLGTFYRSPKPGAAPYVEVGQVVDAETDVCLIEVMKLFTPVKAGTAGKVHAVCIDDGTMVEFGDVLVIIDPS